MRLFRCFIFFALLQLFNAGSAPLCATEEPDNAYLTQPLSERLTSDHLPHKELSLSTAHYLTHFNEENTISFQIRTKHSGRPSQSLSKTPFKLIKGRKVVDLRQHPFLLVNMTRLAGIFSADKYLYSLCRIRI